MLKRGECFGQLTRDLVEECRREEESVDSLPANLFSEIRGRYNYVERQPGELRAAQQRTPHFEGQGIERSVRCLRHAVRRPQFYIVGADDEAIDSAMCNDRALRRTRRTRCEDDIGGILRVSAV